MTNSHALNLDLRISLDSDIRKVCQILGDGGIVALPTETVYGLAADATNEKAVQKIFAAKGRPSFNPLICHFADSRQAADYVDVCPLAQQLMDAYWPGPLSLVLPLKGGNIIAPSVTAGLDTLAVRCPDAAAVRRIIADIQKPIAAPSANRSGRISPTSADLVAADMGGRIDALLNGGTCAVGIESTIVKIENNQIILLRPGSVTADEISEKIDKPVVDYAGEKITSPGQLLNHYAPNAKVRLNASTANAHETMLGFGSIEGDLNLSPTSDLGEAAHNLFAFLSRADQMGNPTIAVAPIPHIGIGIAINDRLKRAAAPKDSAYGNA